MKKKILLALVSMMVLLSQCLPKKDDPTPEDPNNQNEEELITTLKLVMTNNSNSSDVVISQFKDLDGSGGNAPSVFDSIRLTSGATYDVQVYVLNQSVSPADTINAEIEEEKNEHQFFYTATGGFLTPSYKTASDKDDNGVPLGLNPTFTTGSVGKGTLKVTLKHQPDVKPTSGNGNINAGDTDIEVTFGYRIQ